MDETQPRASQPQPQPLEYAGRVYDPNRPAGGIPFVAQLPIGFMTVAAAAIGAAALIAAAVHPALALGIAVVPLVVLTWVARRYWRWRGFVAGVLIGVGLIGLVFGLCLAALRNL